MRHSHLFPPLAEIRAAEATARLGSIKRAAEEIGVTTAAISHQIKALERRLGTTLFDRMAKGLKIRPENESYIDSLSAFLTDLDSFSQRAGQLAQENTITIQMTPSLSVLWFTPILRSFNDSHGQHNVVVIYEGTAGSLASHAPDVVVTFEKADEGAKDGIFLKQRLTPMCSAAFASRHGPFASDRELFSCPIVGYRGVRGDWNKWCRAANIDVALVNPTIQFGHISGALQAAREGLGIVMGRNLHRELISGPSSLVRCSRVVADTGWGGRFVIADHVRHLKKIIVLEHWLRTVVAEVNADRLSISSATSTGL